MSEIEIVAYKKLLATSASLLVTCLTSSNKKLLAAFRMKTEEPTRSTEQQQKALGKHLDGRSAKFKDALGFKKLGVGPWQTELPQRGDVINKSKDGKLCCNLSLPRNIVAQCFFDCKLVTAGAFRSILNSLSFYRYWAHLQSKYRQSLFGLPMKHGPLLLSEASTQVQLVA